MWLCECVAGGAWNSIVESSTCGLTISPVAGAALAPTHSCSAMEHVWFHETAKAQCGGCEKKRINKWSSLACGHEACPVVQCQH